MRKTTPADAPRILEMLFDYFIENQKQKPMHVSMDLIATRRFIEHALSWPLAISYISDDGVILGEIGQTWFGPNKVARGFLWYVKPKARNGLLARRLLKAFDDEAKARGAVYCMNELHNAANLEMIDGFIKNVGYGEYSKSYVKEL